MQGLWSNRRAKVNLNSPAVPAPVSSSSAPKPEETNNLKEIRREISVLKLLKHPNIVQLFEVIQDDVTGKKK